MSLPKVTFESFDKLVLSQKEPVFVLFTTQWSHDNVRLKSLLAQIPGSMEADVDSDVKLSTRFSVRVVPSIWLFQDGEFVASKSSIQIKDVEDLKVMVIKNAN